MIKLVLSSEHLVIGALFVWYVVYTVTRTDGPWQVFLRMRERYPLGGLTTCPKCLAFWLALIFLVLVYFDVAWLAYPFALAGGAIALGAFIGLL